MHTLYLEKQFSTVPQSILNRLWPREGSVFVSCSHMATSKCNSNFWKCSWTHAVTPWQNPAYFYCTVACVAKNHRHLVLIFKVFVTLHLGALCWNWYTTCRHSFCIPSHVTERLAVNLVAKYSSSCFLLVKLTFPAFCYHCPNFLRSVAANKII